MYKSNPLLIFRQDYQKKGNINFAVGNGFRRVELNVNSVDILRLLLRIRTPLTYDALVNLACDELHTDESGSKKVIDYFIAEDIIVTPSDPKQSAVDWEKKGWRDAMDFHLSGQDLIFEPDYTGYVEAMTEYKERVKSGEDVDSPPVFKEYENCQRIQLLNQRKILDQKNYSAVLQNYSLVTKFDDSQVSFEALSELLQNVFGYQSEFDSVSGRLIFRTSPSGGARHPIEAYIYSRNIENVPKGIYHYSVKTNGLSLMKAGNFDEELAVCCSQKTGIKTASLVIFLTARWFRHMWKYRYSRSFRMVLFDAGHIIQTCSLTASALGLKVYHNSALKDEACLRLLDLKDECEEGVIYAMGVGNDGE